MKTVHVNTFSEARRIAYRPIDRDGEICDDPTYYASLIYNCEEYDLDLRFSEKTLAYFNSLAETAERHILANVSTSAIEELHNWYGEDGDYPTVLRKDYEDNTPLKYLTVFKYIVKTGYRNFKFSFYDDLQALDEVCCVSNMGGKEFKFYRGVDPSLFDTIELFIKEQSRNCPDRTVEEFIGENNA